MKNTIIWVDNVELFKVNPFSKTYTNRFKNTLHYEIFEATTFNEAVNAFKATTSFELGMHHFQDAEENDAEITPQGLLFKRYEDLEKVCACCSLGSCLFYIFENNFIGIQCSNTGKAFYCRYD